MNKLSSEVLDFYDDGEGAIFKQRFPQPELVPDFLKEAKWVTPEDREQLSDDLFAFVMNEDGEKLKKFAMTDKANTMLSIIYFLDNGVQKIPPEISKMAAKRLVQGCLWYDIEPPEMLDKIAGGEVPADYVDPNVSTEKTAALGPVVEHKIMAVPSEEKYPLDSYKDTLRAAEYFDKYAARMHPSRRREFATNLVKRAEELGIPVNKKAHLYSSDTYATKGHVAHQIRTRMDKTANDHTKAKYGMLFEKMGGMTPGVAGEALALLDEEAGLDAKWDGAILDPFSSVLAEKTAQDNYLFNDTIAPITDVDLHKMVNTAQSLVEKAMGKDFYKEFRKDPVGIFKSLPLPEKRVLIRLKATERM